MTSPRYSRSSPKGSVAEAVYINEVYVLQYKQKWRFKERKCLKKHLSQFDINDRTKHLEILHTIPKPNINYDSPKAESRVST